MIHLSASFYRYLFWLLHVISPTEKRGGEGLGGSTRTLLWNLGQYWMNNVPHKQIQCCRYMIVKRFIPINLVPFLLENTNFERMTHNNTIGSYNIKLDLSHQVTIQKYFYDFLPFALARIWIYCPIYKELDLSNNGYHRLQAVPLVQSYIYIAFSVFQSHKYCSNQKNIQQFSLLLFHTLLMAKKLAWFNQEL